MKKLLLLLCAYSLAFGVVSCGESPTETDSSSQNEGSGDNENPDGSGGGSENPDGSGDGSDDGGSTGVPGKQIDNDTSISVTDFPVIEINPQIVENSDNTVNVVDDFGAKADGVTNIGAVINEAIVEVAKDPKGGVVYLPKGDYVVSNVVLKSNVHLHIEAGSVLKISNIEGGVRTNMFGVGTVGFISNVVIKGVNGRYKIDISKEVDRHRVFLLKDVHNFEISNVDIYDNKIQFPLITLSYNDELDPEIFGPTDGVIKEASSFNSHYGYGLTQVQCARRVYFENLYGEGGVVLRFETGADAMNNVQFGGVHDCVGKNISGKNGNAVVMISPHSMNCGRVQVTGVRAESCGFAARIENGYINKELDVANVGTYAEGSFLTDVVSYYGTNAQLKQKHFEFMPEELLDDCAPEGYKGISEPSPSIAAVLEVAEYPIVAWNVTSYDYINVPIVREVAERSDE